MVVNVFISPFPLIVYDVYLCIYRDCLHLTSTVSQEICSLWMSIASGAGPCLLSSIFTLVPLLPTGGFSGGVRGVRTPQLHSCTPPTCFAPPQHLLAPPPNIFAPYPRNYSMLNSGVTDFNKFSVTQLPIKQ